MTTTARQDERPRRDRRRGAAGTAALGVVIVNFRGAADTIECLESLLRTDLPMAIVVVENGSSDDSAAVIRDWAAGRSQHAPMNETMAPFSTPPVAKPVALAEVAAADIERQTLPLARLTLIVSDQNLGFAGGNNLGLRYLQQDRRLRHFWLLNNDTVVAPAAPASLLARLDATPNIGMCGTVVCHYWQPDQLQALNGYIYNRFTGAGRALGGDEPTNANYSPQDIADSTDFVLGASLAVSRKFLEDIGPMAEDYFLYYEEIDWATRNLRHKPAPFATAFAHGATVYHKAGRAIGSRSIQSARSAFSDYWLSRARLRFTRRYYPLLLPLHLLVSLGMIARRLIRRQFGNAAAILRASLGLQFK
jgi:GT2 family glycosyltransferase